MRLFEHRQKPPQRRWLPAAGCKNYGAHKVPESEPWGYFEAEKEQFLRSYRERGSKRAVSRTFGVSRNTLTRWPEKRQLKKRREAGPVAEGFSPAKEGVSLNSTSEAVEQTMALGGSVPPNPTGCGACDRGLQCPDLRSALELYSIKPLLKSYR